MGRRLISVVTSCFNEAGNVAELQRRIDAQFALLPQYDYEHIFLDNASTDGTAERVKELIKGNPRVRLIVNARNFGHIRSPMHGILQASGDAIISMASDLQDPPELIPEFIQQWEQGFRVVAGVKPKSEESPLMFLFRRLYYRTIGRISEARQIQNFTGFGLYDRAVIETIRGIGDPYPYFRGLIAELGYQHAEVPYVQPLRTRGVTKSNFYSLYDIAMLGITSHSKVPLRIATFAGFALSGLSLLVALVYLAIKLTHWNEMSLGIAPILIGFFFFASVQLFFIGILGEYVASIHTQVLNRPLVVEKERHNFP